MPKLTIESVGTFDVPTEKRLVNAIEECGVDILHRCGGVARCTTCRVQFIEGEPGQQTTAEQAKLAKQGLEGIRLSCQIKVDSDMRVRVLNTLQSSGLESPGEAAAEEILPTPEWVDVEG